MTSASESRARGRTSLAGILAVAFVATALLQSPAPAATGCATPPPIFPESSIHVGTTGTAKTVVQGTTISSFNVSVLGILNDAVAPGVDLILVKASGPVIDATGGIALGMSGSPVYESGSGDLMGAIAYGGGGDPNIAALLPAQNVLDVLSYPPGSAAASQALGKLRHANTIVLPRSIRQRIAAATGRSLADTTGALWMLYSPLAVSGLSSSRLAKFSERVALRALPFVPYAANAVSAPTAGSPTPLAAGDSFSAMIAYGDITSGAIGTATLVCGDYVMAFGHPQFFDGRTTLGYNGANVLYVDPGTEGSGPFKVANVTEAHGTVDQDRLGGLRGIEGQLPPLMRITSSFTDPDLGRTRAGETDIVRPQFAGEIAGLHVESNLDVLFDEVGGGTSRLLWTIKGTRGDGSPFTLNRGNEFYSTRDVSGSSTQLIQSEISRIVNDRSEDLTITNVDVTGFITEQNLQVQITRVLTASDRQPHLKQRSRLKANPGDDVRVRVFMLPVGSSTEIVANMTVHVPAGAKGMAGSLVLRGGRPPKFCYYCYYSSGVLVGESGSGTSGNGTLSDIASREASFDLIATLFGKRPALARQKTAAQQYIVHGKDSTKVVVVR